MPFRKVRSTRLDTVVARETRLRKFRACRPSIDILEPRQLLTAAPFLVSDISPGSSDSNPGQFTAVGNSVFFIASPMVDDQQLFISNGTGGGTVQLTNVTDAGGANPYQLTNINGTLFFGATDSTNGTELWKSNGTPNGTSVVKDIYPGEGTLGVNSSNPHDFVSFNNEAYFAADDGDGEQIWKSDGTDAGTVRVTSINPGTPTSFGDLVVMGNTLYFFGDDAINGPALWKSDGTAAGTSMVKATGTLPGGGGVGQLTPGTTQLFFVAFDPTNGFQVWRSDGTPGGTAPVKIIDPGETDVSDGPLFLTTIGDIAYFSARDTNGRQLWRSDGTDSGTMILKDIHPGFAANPTGLINVNGTLFFSAEDDDNGAELWTSDGTQAGTNVVTNINPGAGSSNPTGLIDAGGLVYFNAYDGTSIQLYQSDGTAAGTQRVGVINPTGDAFDDSNGHGEMAAANGTLYFDATDGTSGQELWAYQFAAPVQTQTLTVTSIVSSENPAGNGDAVGFTATVSGAGAIPTGSVSFFDGTTLLGTVALDSNDMATLAPMVLTVGDHSITAQYPGNSLFAPSTSPVLTQTVSATPPASLVPDLSGALGSLPASVVAGTRLHNMVPVAISNPTASTISGFVTIDLYATTDAGTIAGGTLIGTVTKKLSLKPQKVARLKVKVPQVPATLPDGTYNIVAQLTDPASLTRLAASPATVQVAAAFIQPSAMLGTVSPPSIVAGKHGAATLLLTNLGNIPAAGILSIQIDPSTDGQTPIAGQPLATLSKHISIKPGATAKLKLRLTIPATLAPLSYIPLATVSVAGVAAPVAAGTAFTVT